jgi:hypothetical protein
MEKEKEKPVGPVVLQEDGITFLSVKELDDYREQKILLAWQEGAYV